MNNLQRRLEEIREDLFLDLDKTSGSFSVYCKKIFDHLPSVLHLLPQTGVSSPTTDPCGGLKEDTE